MAGLMADPRVVRGSTKSGGVVGGGKSGKRLSAQATPGVKRVPRERWSESRAPTPPPLDGRLHCLLQTDDYIEILTNQSGNLQQTQTSAFLDRPEEPLFNRAKIDNDVPTQVEPGDIFAFDIEVEPVLELLMKSTLRKFKSRM